MKQRKKRERKADDAHGKKAPGKASRVKSRKEKNARDGVIELGAPTPVLLLESPKGRLVHLRAALAAWTTRAHLALADAWQRALHATRDAAARTWTELRPLLIRTGQGLGFLAVVTAVLAVLFVAYSAFIDTRVLPSTTIAGVSIGWRTPADALRVLEEKAATFERDGLTLVLPARSVQLHPGEDLGIQPDLRAALDAAMRDGRTGDILEQQRQRAVALLVGTDIALPGSVNRDVVATKLRARVEELAQQPVEPVLAWTKEGLVLTPGVSAEAADLRAIVDEVERGAGLLSPRTIPVALSREAPRISDIEAARARDQALSLVNTPIVLSALENKRSGPWKLDLAMHTDWITFTPDGASLAVLLDPEKLTAYLTENVASVINQEHSDAHVTRASADSWRVTVDGRASDGQHLRIEDAVTAINAGLFPPANAKELAVVLPVDVEPGRILDESGNDLGLHDLLAHARSNFSGSPSGRDFNVRKGMKIFNGLLIPQGATFSFNSFLGPVDGAHGWKDALTIFDGGLNTRMDPGGGICQVSTTVYQAAILSGMKVQVRRAHSYFVSYYAKAPGLNGIDATIFPGSQDLVLVNDTPGPILMLAGADGDIAYVQLFGTKDRSVELSGPFKSGSYGAGAPLLTVDSSLAPGQVVIEKNGHTGFSITWKQTVTFADGKKETNTIFSGYKAIPAQGRKGPSAADLVPPVVAAN